MKRLLRIGSGLFIYSIVPIASWMLLAVIFGDPNIANVFSLTYPLQFVWAVCKSLFGTGANIRKEKENNENAVLSSIVVGTIVSALCFAVPIIFADNYILFFNLDPSIYKIWTIYSCVQMFLQTQFSLVLEKLYFEDKEKIATRHMFAFNFLNFACVILSALIFKNAIVSICITLCVLFCYVICLFVWQFKKFKFDFNLFKNFRYKSASIVGKCLMFTTYFFGLKTAFSMGAEYIVALNFATLCTDTQWDATFAIDTVTEVDLAKKRFNFKKTFVLSFLYTLILLSTSCIMFISFYKAYDVVLKLGICYMLFQFFSFLLSPFYTIMGCVTQLEVSATLNTGIELCAMVVRTVLSMFLLSPFCTDIGQMFNGVFSCTMYAIILFKVFWVKNGFLIKKRDKNWNIIKNNLKPLN